MEGVFILPPCVNANNTTDAKAVETLLCFDTLIKHIANDLPKIRTTFV